MTGAYIAGMLNWSMQCGQVTVFHLYVAYFPKHTTVMHQL